MDTKTSVFLTDPEKLEVRCTYLEGPKMYSFRIEEETSDLTIFTKNPQELVQSISQALENLNTNERSMVTWK